MSVIKKVDSTNAGEDVGRKKRLFTASERVTSVAIKISIGFCQKIKIKMELPYDPDTPLLGILPTDSIRHHRDRRTSIFTTVLTTHNTKEMEPAYMSINRRMENENMSFVDTEFYPTTKQRNLEGTACIWKLLY